MGFETFRIELRGGSASFDLVADIVSQQPHARVDHESISYAETDNYTIEDGTHVIEVEVADHPVRVSCRFTLCHPPSVDSAFLSLVQHLQLRLGMEIKLCDDVHHEFDSWYPAERFSEFEQRAMTLIAARRAEWIAHFGTRQFAASTVEVYHTIILPLCEPVTSSTDRLVR